MEEIINYIMETPENVNGNILREKLQKMGGSGGGAVYATFTEDNGTWSCDKTYAELKAAYDAGNVILAQYSLDRELTIATPMAFMENEQVSALVARYTIQNAIDIAGVHFLTITLMNSTALVFGSVEEFVCESSAKR